MALEHGIPRRDALRAAAGALASLTAASAAPVALTIGIATTDFRKHTNSALAAELRQAGVHTIQLFLTQTDSNYWKYNGRSDLAGLTRERAAEIAAIYRAQGHSIHSLGVYTNLIHPDEAERRANLAYFEAMMKVGDAMRVHTFISEAGHYRAPGPENGDAYHWREDVWNMMVATGKELARLAADNGATVLLEPYFEGFLASAKRTRMFLEEVGSARIRALLDPANILEVNDLEEMFGQLGEWIECFHAKDRKRHVIRGVAPGAGDLDYRRFVELVAARKPRAPLIVEYVGAANYAQALAHLRGVLRASGVAER